MKIHGLMRAPRAIMMVASWGQAARAPLVVLPGKHVPVAYQLQPCGSHCALPNVLPIGQS